MNTAPEYIHRNPHLLVSLLYLDFDLYEPTKFALQLFVDRMCSGSIVVFDELNCQNFPGETLAFLEFSKDKGLTLHRSHLDPWISWTVL